MADVNPRQFISLDYANADMYSALSQRPAPATPLQKATSVTQTNRDNPSARAMEQNLWQQESARNAGYFLEQKQQSEAREQEITRREQAQRQEIANRVSNNSPTSQEVAQPPLETSLNQPPPSTPEQQPAPSTGSPPPTPNGTAARASGLVEPTATPGPAMLAKRIPPPSGGGGAGLGFSDALPRSLPQSAGRLAVPGAFAAVDFGIRVYQGQPVGQAASGSVAGAVGTFGGAALGAAIAGPVGAVIGGMVGGYVAGAISDSFFHSPPSTGSPPSEIPNYPPFRGGQASTTYSWNFWSGRMMREHDGGFVYSFPCIGPVSDFKRLGILNTDESVSPPAVNYACQFTDGNGQITGGSVVCDKDGDLPFLILHRIDAKPDPDIIAPAPPPDNKPYYFAGTFLNGDATIPSGKPAAGTNKGKNPDPGPGIPGNNTHNGNGYFPGHGGLAPSSTPNPTQYASNLGGMLPGAGAAPAPPPFAEQKDTPGLRFAPAPGGSPSPNPGGSASSAPGGSASSDLGGSPSPPPDPNVSRIDNGVVTSPRILTAQPIPLGSSPVTIPSGSPTTKKQNPTPDGTSPVPKVDTAPTPKTPETTTDKTNQIIQQQKQSFDEQIARLTTIGGLIAGLTPIVQGMPDIIAGLTPVIQGIPDAIAKSPVVQAANKATTQGAVCEIAKPGGCLGDALDNNADKINQNNDKNTDSLLDKINAGANAAQLALLNIINNKLGEQLTGGISGFLKTFFEGFKKLADWLHLDRALNLLTFVMTVQNVYFLCDSMKVVTLQMISDMLAVIGIKDKDNNPLNLNEILGSEVESLLKSILGEQQLSGFKKEWKAFNRIYQAATNTLFAIQNMVFSVLQALEIIGSWNASIGNALKKYLVVGQSAFSWMNPNPNFHNNFFKFMGNALNVVTSLDFVAQSILQGRQAIDDFGKQTDELSKGISEASDGFKPPENKATAEAATKSANSSKSPTPSPEDVKSVQD